MFHITFIALQRGFLCVYGKLESAELATACVASDNEKEKCRKYQSLRESAVGN